jgi:hypothetical protein
MPGRRIAQSAAKVMARKIIVPVESFIGHKIGDNRLPCVLRIYNHAEYLLERQAALKTWAERIEVLANESNVI